MYFIRNKVPRHIERKISESADVFYGRTTGTSVYDCHKVITIFIFIENNIQCTLKNKAL